MALNSSNSYDLNKTRYTHRDYESVREDLIAAIPSLTQEWTNRGESDPGIVLIKLMAMFSDTLSYNVDKIALELYLQSVTQRKNCAKILSLLGYKMHWYRSGRVLAHVRLKVSQDSLYNTKHMILTPYRTKFIAGNISYTVLGTNGTSDEIDISSDQITTAVSLIEGEPVSTSFDHNSLINNRYYFNSSNPDEEEIRLSIEGASSSRVTCELVDNLYLYSSSSKIYYEFGVDEYDKPYIELADNWADIAGTDTCRFNLKYIRSSGVFGDISSNSFTAVTGARGTASMRDLVITNLTNTTKYGEDGQLLDTFNAPGRHPETVDIARRSAANYIFTHDTLVTSYDFERACKREDGITVSKLVDAQVVINDELDLTEIASRALDEFKTVFVEESSLTEPEVPEVFERLINYQVIMYLAYQNFNPVYNYYFSSTKGQASPYSIYDPEYDPYSKYYWNLSEKFYTDGVDSEFVFSNRPYPDNDHLKIYKVIEGVEELIPSSEYSYNPTTGTVLFNTPPSSDFDYIELKRDYGESPGYYPYKVNDNILLTIRERLSKLQMLNVRTDFGTMKVFPFKVKGTLHLVDQYSPEVTLQIVDRINDALVSAYYPSRHDIGEKPNFIELVDIIQGSDSRIKYFDAIGPIVEWAPEVRARMNDPIDCTEKFVGSGRMDGESWVGRKEFTLQQGTPAETPTVKVNGVEVDSDDPTYGFDYDQGTVTFNKAPAFGDVILITNGLVTNYFNTIFDTTSAIMYNGLKDVPSDTDNDKDVPDVFNLHQRYLKYRFRNIISSVDSSDDLLNQLVTGSESGAIYVPADYGTAYLVNYSRAANLDYTKRILPNVNTVIQINNIPELRALCRDLTFKGIEDIQYIRIVKETSVEASDCPKEFFQIENVVDPENGNMEEMDIYYYTNEDDKFYFDKGEYKTEVTEVKYKGTLRKIVVDEERNRKFIVTSTEFEEHDDSGYTYLDSSALAFINSAISTADYSIHFKFLFDESYFLTKDQSIVADKPYYIYNEDDNLYEQVQFPEVSGLSVYYNCIGDFFLSPDTSVVSGKTYYEYISGKYVVVDNPAGNPHSLNYYETVSADIDKSVVVSSRKYEDAIDDGTPLSNVYSKIYDINSYIKQNITTDTPDPTPMSLGLYYSKVDNPKYPWKTTYVPTTDTVSLKQVTADAVYNSDKVYYSKNASGHYTLVQSPSSLEGLYEINLEVDLYEVVPEEHVIITTLINNTGLQYVEEF